MSKKLRPSLMLFVNAYIGSSLQHLSIGDIDNSVLQYLKTYCPNLQELSLYEGNYKDCDFTLLPASLTFLEIVAEKKEYPHSWFVPFTQDHFPHMKTLKLQDPRPSCNAAIIQIASLKSLRNLELFLFDGPSAKAFSALMQLPDLEQLGLIAMGSLPDDYASQIVYNLPKLKQINLTRSERYFTARDVEVLAQIPNLEKLMIPSTTADNFFGQDIMKAVIKVISSMDKLKEVEFDDEDWPSDDQAPKDLAKMLKTLRQLRPDVSIVFRGVSVLGEDYKWFKERYIGEGEPSDEESSDSSDE